MGAIKHASDSDVAETLCIVDSEQHPGARLREWRLAASGIIVPIECVAH